MFELDSAADVCYLGVFERCDIDLAPIYFDKNGFVYAVNDLILNNFCLCAAV